MRVLLQRVKRAVVRVGEETVASIGHGVLLFVAFRTGDRDEDLGWMAEKVAHLRIFEDAVGKMNRSLMEVGGEALAVSQFTLYGDARKGRRPSFVDAAPPAAAVPLYQRFVALLRERSGGIRVETGEFGAMMEVELVNDGPVTLILERQGAVSGER